ncbi:MAG TPA: hypothetical protein VNJ52_06250 [Patescibacteria group bacterium]|nr:hypothetical protein [Patescibacteria group bacterium]
MAQNGKYGNVVLQKLSRIVFGAVFVCVCLAPVTARSQQVNLSFRNIGPAQTGGRVTAVLGIPGNYDAHYLGAAGDGIG